MFQKKLRLWQHRIPIFGIVLLLTAQVSMADAGNPAPPSGGGKGFNILPLLAFAGAGIAMAICGGKEKKEKQEEVAVVDTLDTTPVMAVEPEPVPEWRVLAIQALSEVGLVATLDSDVRRIRFEEVVLFDTDDSNLNDAGRQTIVQRVESWGQLSSEEAEVLEEYCFLSNEGHADSRADDRLNDPLSWRRSKTVEDGQSAIPMEQKSIGFGERRLLVPMEGDVSENRAVVTYLELKPEVSDGTSLAKKLVEPKTEQPVEE